MMTAADLLPAMLVLGAVILALALDILALATWIHSWWLR